MEEKMLTMWNNFVTSGGIDDSKTVDAKFVNTFSIVGLTFLLLFGLFRFYAGESFAGVIDICAAGAGFLNLIVLRSSKNIQFASTTMLLVMLSIFFFFLMTQGINYSAILWFFTFPVLAFFLKRRKQGLVWVLIMYAELLIAFILEYFNFVLLPHTMASVFEVATLMGSLISVTSLVYFYQDIYEKNADALIVRADDLRYEIKKREDLQKSIADAAAEVKKNNENLEDTKKAMLNLLEDLNAEKAKILQERAKDEAILGSIGDGVFAIDIQKKIILFNPVAETLSGIKAADALGKKYDTVLKFIYEDNGNENNAFISTALKGTKTKMANRTALVSGSGQTVPVADSAAPVRDEKGNVTGAVVVFRDVTQERQVDKAKTEFVSLASHQLRTPLSAINWYSELLLDGSSGKISKKQKELIAQISSSNSRMVELVNSLLNVSRIDMGTMASSPKQTSLKDLIDSVLSELAPPIKNKSLVLKKAYEAGVPETMNVDPQLMRIIIQNLLSNAVKYTPAKGSITVALAPEKKNIHLSVADTGYGIPQAQQEKIFTKLFRADNAKEADPDGNGLGLYLVKSVIEQNNGRVWFESQEGKGTTFHITLPLTGMKAIEGSKTLQS